MKTYSYTATRTRTEAVVDQFEIFLRYAGINESRRNTVLSLIDRRYLEKVGVYLTDAQGKRILEVSAEIDWTMHSDFAAISPHLRTDLPGWESGGAPEIHTLGHRFAKKMEEYGRQSSHWVIFALLIRSNEDLHRRLCVETGYEFRGGIPAWRNPPVRRDDMPLLDLEEVNLSIREA